MLQNAVCVVLFTASACAFHCSVFLFSCPHPAQAIFHLDSLRAGHRELSCAGGDGRNAFLLGTRVLPGKHCVFLSALPTSASQIKLPLAILAELTALGLFWPPHYLIWKCFIKYVIPCGHRECMFITKLKNNIMVFST